MILKIKLIGAFLLMALMFFACGPTSENTDSEELSSASKSWIPFIGSESVTFININRDGDTTTLIFNGQTKETWYENVRYMTDQSGFFTVQKDFYADLERQELIFTSPTTDYYMKYALERNKGETGDWDILRLELAEGNYYKNEMKIVIYQTDTYDKGEYFSFKTNVTLAGQAYSDVYFIKQERRPFELYYTQLQGVIGFKLSSNELFTLQADTLQ